MFSFNENVHKFVLVAGDAEEFKVYGFTSLSKLVEFIEQQFAGETDSEVIFRRVADAMSDEGIDRSLAIYPAIVYADLTEPLEE